MKTRKMILKIVYILTFTICNLSFVNGQNPTGICTVLNQPCDSNGVLVTTITSGMTPPLTFTYHYTIVHSNVNSMTDTLYNIISPFYNVYVTDTFGQSIYINTGLVAPFSIDYPVITTNAICPDTLGSAYLTINNGTLPSSVQWFIIDGTNTVQYTTTGNPANLPIGNISAIVTDANGCISSLSVYDSVSISQTSNINYNVTTTTANCTNGTATISNISGGVSPYTINWINGANTPSINNLLSGYYYVTVTDSLGCLKQGSAHILQAVNISVNTSVTNATCLGNNGSVISFGSGGISPYTYSYSNGFTGQSITGLNGGTSLYVTATDVNGCFGTTYANINISTPIIVNYSTTPSTCTIANGSATLNISGGTIPYDIEWNTSPPQNGITLNNVATGQYSFIVTDAVGCIRSGTVYISELSNLYANIIATDYTCPNNLGSASINVSGNNPPFTFIWSTVATTQSITNIPAGYYTCTVTDNVGCFKVLCAWIHMLTPINIGFISTPASCIFNNDGSIQAIPTGGTAPYTYHWSNGQTGQTAINLNYGWYTVIVQDANGCTQVDYTFLDYNHNNDSCYCKITGKVFVDQNNDCIYDTSEIKVEHIMIHCTGIGYSFTNANGIYSFLVSSGNYTLSESVQNIYPLALCQNNSININATASHGCTITENFANIINPLHDIHIIRTGINMPVPGNNYYQKLIIENDGTISEPNIQIGFKHDGQLQYSNSLPNYYTQLSPVINPDWYSTNVGFPNLSPGSSQVLITSYNVPVNIPLGTIVDFFDTTAYSSPMSNWLTDYTPWNNVSSYQATVVGSFDPNFKEVIPKGTGSEGLILNSDSVLTYVIHFENTGTYYAQNIVVTDTLDSNLDWSSIRPGYSDHNYSAEVSEDGVLKFTFANIYLPWSWNYNISTTGLVTYSIKLNNNLIVGTQIKNKAAIFFDYNAPIMTNTTLNTISNSVEIKELIYPQNVNVYPNPFNIKTTLEFSNPDNSLYTLKIIDITGKEVKTIENIRTNKIIIEKNNLSNGFYTIELRGKNIFRSKIIIN